MSGVADTIARLSIMGAMPFVGHGHAPGSRLTPLADFGANPGALRGLAFVPDDLAPGAALVVVLHGCTQTAEGYDRGAGWSQLAAEEGFAVLFPEQLRANNANLCFNWFERGDVTRGQGEVGSIRNMIAAMLSRHDLDPARVFVTGLSAGGAMTAALLAAYPDQFAGGAIIAGLPHGAAEGVAQALQRMRSAAPMQNLGARDAIRAATGHDGPWPTVSVWHGDANHVVDASNGAAIVEQWRAIHGVDQPASEQRFAGQSRRVWRDRSGRAVIEQWTIAGMGHGTPLATSGSDACGKAGPHMLEVGVSSTRHIARFWGLLPPVEVSAAVASDAARPVRREETLEAVGKAALEGVGKAGVGGASTSGLRWVGEAARPALTGPRAVIESALRAAGLMK